MSHLFNCLLFLMHILSFIICVALLCDLYENLGYVSLLTFFFHFQDGSAFGLEIIPCFPAVKNGPCNMTCKVPDNSQQVEINCNGTSRASCSIVYCHPDMIKEGTDTIRFKISSLSYTRDNCEWTCSDGIVPSPGINVTIYSEYLFHLVKLRFPSMLDDLKFNMF